MKAKLINVGRNSVNKIVEVKNAKELQKEIGKHLSSKGWGLELESESPERYSINTGWRTAGEVIILEE